MEDLEEKTKLQTSLFDNAESGDLYFVTTQRNLMSFLGAGAIVPAGSQFRYKTDTREAFGGAIPFWKGAVPDVGEYSDLRNDQRAVVIGCGVDDVAKYGGRHRVLVTDRIIVVNAPIPLWCVSSIYMHSSAVIDDFLIRLPDDVVADRAVFGGMPDIPTFAGYSDLEFTPPEDIEPKLAFIDALAGGVKALQKFADMGISDHGYIFDLLAVCLNSGQSEFAALEENVIIEHKLNLSDSDQHILKHVFPELSKFKPEDGFDSLELLDSLKATVSEEQGTLFEEVVEWISIVEKVLEAEIEVRDLTDKGGIFKRAVLLFLIRPDLDRLTASVNSSISPGPAVLSVAAFLAGYGCGISRMGQAYKGDYRDFNGFMRSFLDSLWCKSNYTLNSITEPASNFGVSLKYVINNESILRLNIEPDTILARVVNQARSLGYELAYDHENEELYHTLDFENGRTQTVFIEKQKPLSDGMDVIRFVSPCLDLAGSKAKLLTKAKAVDLLARNSDEITYCSFAYSERREAIVVQATQIVRTMDDDEFEMLLKFVGAVADEYERDVAGKDNF